MVLWNFNNKKMLLLYLRKPDFTRGKYLERIYEHHSIRTIEFGFGEKCPNTELFPVRI